MYEAIRLFTALVQPICVTETYDKVRGREEHRRIERQHWFIENKLHWVKDVILHEDNMTISLPQMATIVGYFNTVVLNILRLAGYKPTKNTFAFFTDKVNELSNLF